MSRYILDECRAAFGLSRVEGKQKVLDKETGEPWEIDVVGYTEEGKRVLFECRHRKAKVKKSEVQSLVCIVRDTGAEKGYFVNYIGLQAGAKRVARAKKIDSVIIPKGGTPEDYIMQCLHQIFAKTTHHLALADVAKMAVVGPDGQVKQSVETSHSE